MSHEIGGNDIEVRVRAALTASGEPFEIIDCDPELADTAAFCAAYGYSPDKQVLCPPRTLPAMPNVTVIVKFATAIATE